jgi:hypothetical protein
LRDVFEGHEEEAMSKIAERAARILRVATLISLILGLPVVATGCEGENTPKYWAKRIKKPAYREMGIKRMNEIYMERLNQAGGDREAPAVKEAETIMVPALIETFNKYKTDNASRSAIATLLAQMQSPDAIPVFEELLAYQKGINETDASKAAEALGILGSDDSIPKIIGMLDAIKADRGVDGRNRPEDDWMSRSAVQAMAAILKKKPDSPHRAAAIAALNEALETTADQQDFFINKVAAKALGDIADPSSAGILIRGLFFQGRGATIFQQCRVGLLKIAIENRKAVLEQLFAAYKGENKELKKDAEKFKHFHGIHQNKIGLMFYELRIHPEQDKAIYDFLLARVQDEEIDKEGVLQGMATETLAMLGYEPLIDHILVMVEEKDWLQDSLNYKVFASFMSGIMGTNSLKMPMTFNEKLMPLMWKVLEEMEGDSYAPFRVSAGLMASSIASAGDEAKFKEFVANEKNEDVKKQFEGFAERFGPKAECKKDKACWMGKLKVDDKEWRTKQLAVLWLGELAEPGDAAAIEAISGLLNQGKDRDEKLLGSRNQDVLKAVVIALDKLSPSGCVGKECDRLKLVTPYFRKKPQYGVLANSSECLHARLLQRGGGKLTDILPGEDSGDVGDDSE